MYNDLTKEELNDRLNRFIAAMDAAHEGWDTALIAGKVNQYYLTGTMQDGLLAVRKNKDAFYFVYRSFERAMDESPLKCIFSMGGYRDAASAMGSACGNTYIDAETVTVSMLERMKKHFDMASIRPLDGDLLRVRAVKSPYELKWTESSGRQHAFVLNEVVPTLLREGMSEAELTAALFEKMVCHGHHGVSRFAMFQTEIIVGQIGFGESAIYPTSFNGPGGGYGLCAAVPLLGSRERKLKKGDLVFVDVGFGQNGYHTDKTQVYSFGAPPSDEARKTHRACMDVQKRLAEMLRPGAIPSDIYHTVMNGLGEDFKEHFMGFGNRRVRFFGHGVGLHIDEWPVIAGGFDMPLEENMVIALEPKKGIPGVGLAGVEETYVVTPDGGRCVTGGARDIVTV